MKYDSTRRDFLAAFGSAVGAASMLSRSVTAAALVAPDPGGLAFVRAPDLASSHASEKVTTAGQTTIQDVVDLIVNSIPGAPLEDTVDTFKAGDPSQPVTGVVSTFLPTCEVIETAASMGANLIITHEPTFYNHLDQTEWLEDDPVYAYKRRLLDRHGIAVWRFHDAWHLYEPDGILTGFLRKLGWEDYPVSDADRRNLPSILEIPPQSLSELAAYCKQRLAISHPIQLVGDPEMTCRRVGLMLGAYGGRGQIGFLGGSDIDVLMVGEINEWETSVYVQDARSMGRSSSLLILGHANSEEPGMEYMVEWLKAALPDVPVHHVASGDPFVLV